LVAKNDRYDAKSDTIFFQGRKPISGTRAEEMMRLRGGQGSDSEPWYAPVIRIALEALVEALRKK
jgi:hypothetical protein